jgi:hypothetical protein
VNLPELSVDGLHASETLKGVTAVTRKFFGAVGLIVSRHHADAGKANVNASVKTIPFKHTLTRKSFRTDNLHPFVIKEPFLS